MPEAEDKPGALFAAGKLAAAIEAANAQVRRSPAELGGRVLLAELLLFAGNIERADTILDAAGQIDPTAMPGVAEFRQLLRAEQARRQFRRDGRVPEFLGEPTPALQSILAASVALRAGDAQEAARLVAEAEEQRPMAAGTMAAPDGEAVTFDDFRDIDDWHAGFFEVLTTTGKYFWIPTERVLSVEFHPPRRPRDLALRRATMSVAAGPDGEVYLPTIYDWPDVDVDDQLRLGRATDWRGPEGGPVQGLGQRIFLAGEEACSIMELSRLEFGT
jgi:type VI secretion system protein ImpE